MARVRKSFHVFLCIALAAAGAALSTSASLAQEALHNPSKDVLKKACDKIVGTFTVEPSGAYNCVDAANHRATYCTGASECTNWITPRSDGAAAKKETVQKECSQKGGSFVVEPSGAYSCTELANHEVINCTASGQCARVVSSRPYKGDNASPRGDGRKN
jgi:hypothetical protein